MVAGVTICALALMVVEGNEWNKARNSRPAQISTSKFTECKLKAIVPVNESTSIYNISGKLNETQPPFHVILKDDSCQVGRQYSPTHVTGDDFLLIVKRYGGGHMSQMLSSLKPGDLVSVAGPIPSSADGYNKLKSGKLLLVAGGTGITAMYQIIKHELTRPNPPRIELVYGARTPEDLLLLGELSLLSRDLLRITCIVETPDMTWKGNVGRINASLLKSLQMDVTDTSAVICGTDG